MSKIKIAVKNDKFVHIDEVERGEQDCICTTCNTQLIVKDGGDRTKHFSHKSKIECIWNKESALHLLGKQILIDNSIINLPKHGKIQYWLPEEEKHLLNSLKRSDVKAYYAEQPIHFEIYVTNKVDSDKQNLYISNNEKCVEICLKTLIYSSFSEIEYAVLEQKSNKKIINWQNQSFKFGAELKKKIGEIIIVLAFLTIIYKSIRFVLKVIFK